MREAISDTAEYGDMVIGKKVITSDTRKNMKKILEDIQSGEFAKDWILENRAGRPVYNSIKNKEKNHLIEEVGKKERSIGKTINYAVIYGMSAYHLSQRMDISMNEAQSFIDTYYKEYSGVQRFKEELIRDAERKGYVETYFGRRRYIPELLSRDKNIQNSGIRIAVNAPIQGTASEIVKLAMIKIARQQFPIDMLLQIHDELIFEGETELLEKYSSDIAEIMETIVHFDVEMRIDYNIGKNWLVIH